MSAQTTMATLRAATMADATALGRMILEGHVDAPSSPFEADELEPEPALLGGEFILAALDGSELLFRLAARAHIRDLELLSPSSAIRFER